MKAQIGKSLQMALLVLALGALVGCGTSKSGDSFGSIDNSSTDTLAPDASTDAQALCSQNLTSTGDTFQVRLMKYVDSYNQSRSDFVRLQFRVPPTGWQNGNWDMLIYRWTASPDGSSSIDSTPLFYQFEKKVPAGFQLISTHSYQIFNWAEVVQMGEYAQINTSSPQSFFTPISLLVNLKDSTNSYQVLRVVFRQNGSVVTESDVLIPTFLANPAKYNADSRHPLALQVLHPLKDKLNQSWSETNYYEFARAFCF